MKKTQNNKQLVILVLEAKEKILTFKVRTLLDVSCPKLHMVSKLQDLYKLHKLSKLPKLHKLLLAPQALQAPQAP
jgi:hypothetical protein